MNTTSRMLLLALSTAVLLPAPADAQGFTRGALFFYSSNLTGGTSAHGILRIDPLTGAAARLVSFAQVPNTLDSLAYDAHRDSLLFFGKQSSTQEPNSLWATDGQGAVTNLGFAGTNFWSMAPVGDGRVYFFKNGATLGEVHYIDAADQLHELLDASGTQRFSWGGAARFDYRQMIYHAPSRSLIAVARVGGFNSCAGTPAAGVVVRRVALSADGTRVVGPVLCNEFDVSSTLEMPVGLSLMADGDLLLVVDTNTGALEDRMLRVDPWTLAITPYAANGGYAGATATNGGTFSTVRGQAVIVDGVTPTLRAYGSGESGPGTPIPPSIRLVLVGNGPTNSLIEIRASPCRGSSTGYGDGLAGAGGYEPTLGVEGCPIPGGAITLHLGSAVGGAPALLLLGSAPAALPFAGGQLLVAPALSLPLLVGGTPGVPGRGHLALPIPLQSSPALSGATVYFQAVCLDPAAPESLSFTAGLQLTLG